MDGQNEALNTATGNGTYLRLDGTSTTTAEIPFAQGISLPNDRFVTFGTGNTIGFDTGNDAFTIDTGSNVISINGQELSVVTVGTTIFSANLFYIQSASFFSRSHFPESNNAYDLGSASLYWRNVYIGTQLFSNVSGVAPFVISSTTLVTNLNADMLDGLHLGTSGNTIPALTGNNTWTNDQVMSGTFRWYFNSSTAGPSIYSTGVGGYLELLTPNPAMETAVWGINLKTGSVSSTTLTRNTGSIILTTGNISSFDGATGSIQFTIGDILSSATGAVGNFEFIAGSTIGSLSSFDASYFAFYGGSPASGGAGSYVWFLTTDGNGGDTYGVVVASTPGLNSHSFTGNPYSVYLENILEVDGATFLDAALTVASISTFNGNVLIGEDISVDWGLGAFSITYVSASNQIIIENPDFPADVIFNLTTNHSGSILPTSDSSYDFGGSSLKWRDGWFGRSLTVNSNSTTALFVERDGVNDNVFVVDTTNASIGMNRAIDTANTLSITELTKANVINIQHTLTSAVRPISISVTEDWNFNGSFVSPGATVLQFFMYDNRAVSTAGSTDIVTPIYVTLQRPQSGTASSTKAGPGINMAVFNINESASMTYSANISTYTTATIASSVAAGTQTFAFTWTGTNSFTHVNRWADSNITFNPTVTGGGTYRLNHYAFVARGTGTTTGNTYSVGFYHALTGFDVGWGYVNETTVANNYMGGDNTKTYWGTGTGSVSARTLASDASVTYDGTNLVWNTREIGSGAFQITYNLQVSPVQDVLSQFGGAWTSSIVSTSDSNDRLVVTKVSTATGNKRAGLFITEHNAQSSHAGGVMSLNAYTVILGSNNYTSTTFGGGLRGGRYVSSHEGSGTVSQGSAFSALIQSTSTGNITDTATFHAESPAVASGTTWTTHAGLWIRGGSIVGTITTRYGIRIDDLSGGSTIFGIALQSDANAIVFGAGNDATILYDGTNLVINPKLVGSGIVNITGGLQCDSITNDTGLAAGTYTPTRSAETNLDSNVTMTEAQYLRVGNTITVSGRFTADPTLTATATSFEITLPVASNIGAAEDAAGVAYCGAIAGQGAEIIGVAGNDTAKIQWIAGDVTSQTWSYTFSYQVI